jgi:hypothetical protein
LDRAIAWQSGSSRADRSLNVVASDRPHRTGGAADGFYRAIALRHTNRYAYERSKAVPADWREFLRRTGDDQGARVILFDEGGDRREFDAAVVEATQAIIDDKTMIADSDRWFRSSAAEIEAYRQTGDDGVVEPDELFPALVGLVLVATLPSGSVRAIASNASMLMAILIMASGPETSQAVRAWP